MAVPTSIPVYETCRRQAADSMSSTGASCRIGIDLGTSKSGYTYSFDADPRHAGKTPEYWPGESAGEAKTDTALLYVAQSGRWQYDCWGKEALTK